MAFKERKIMYVGIHVFTKSFEAKNQDFNFFKKKIYN